jgi:dTDP-4-amino-4,6-dideoxygalactose transaminase
MNDTGDPFRVPRWRVDDTHYALRDDLHAALDRVLFGTMKTGYEVREAFEDAFAQTMQQRYCVAVHSGTMGLFIALRACGIGVGDEVITVANADISTTAAIRHCGAIPILCDVQASDYTINPDLIEALITPRTRALVPVDLHGHPANVAQLRMIADRHGLRIVEDAALAAGSRDFGKPLGAFADVTVYSFAPLKPLGSLGNGAALVTQDADLYARLRLLTYYGHSPEMTELGHQHYIAEGYNVPLDTLQAALLSVKLPYLQAWTDQRRVIVQKYERGLATTSAMLPRFRPDSESTFRAYTICVPRRPTVYRLLRDAGIEVVLHYAPPIYQHPVYGGRLLGSQALPVTDRLADELLCLPVSPEYTDVEIGYVIDVLCQLLEETS